MNQRRRFNQRSRVVLTETQLRQIIFDELVAQHVSLMQEGMWDDVKDGVKKISDAVTAKFKDIALKWASTIADALQKMGDGVPDDAKKIVQVLKQAMKESGESIELDDTLKLAKEFSKLNQSAVLSIVQQDLEGPVHEKAQEAESQKKEGLYLSGAYSVLSEHSLSFERFRMKQTDRRLLKEDFGLSAILGVSLGVMGFLPMLFKGLHKLAEYINAPKTAELFEKAEHITHAFEQAVVTTMVPDKLAYFIYKGMWNIGIKLTKGKKPRDEHEMIDEDGRAALNKAKNLAYKILLIIFAYEGVKHVLHAGASLVGFVHGAATGVKGVEIATGAAEVANIIKTATKTAEAL